MGYFRATRALPRVVTRPSAHLPQAPRDYMQHTHEGPSQALDAFALIGAARMIPIHFDTYVNSDDAPGACGAELRTQMRARGLSDAQVSILGIGAERVLLAK